MKATWPAADRFSRSSTTATLASSSITPKRTSLWRSANWLRPRAAATSTTAAQARLHASIAQAEIKLETERVADAKLLAPIDGVVVTPKIEEKTGVLLQPGDALCELVEQRRMAVDMNVVETDLALVRQGEHVALKLNAFPTETFDGIVDRVGARSAPVEGEQFFVVRAVFENSRKSGEGRDGRARQNSFGRRMVWNGMVSGGLCAPAFSGAMDLGEIVGLAAVSIE